MSEHTPGPWRIEGDIVKTVISDGFKHVATVNYFNCGTGDPRTISKKEHAANARLIAKAPELIEALRDLADFQNGPPLVKYADEWRKAHDRAYQLLGEVDG
jgi:hypothetical protein